MLRLADAGVVGEGLTVDLVAWNVTAVVRLCSIIVQASRWGDGGRSGVCAAGFKGSAFDGTGGTGSGCHQVGLRTGGCTGGPYPGQERGRRGH
jgi:hypothetical protein